MRKLSEKTCVICGATFLTEYHHKKTCSPECAKERNRQAVRAYNAMLRENKIRQAEAGKRREQARHNLDRSLSMYYKHIEEHGFITYGKWKLQKEIEERQNNDRI